MKISYVYQINYQHQVSYEFNEDVITANVNGETDTFDFSSMPNDSIAQSISSSLPIIVVTEAKKDKNGELWIRLFKPITFEENESGISEEWIDV